MSECSHDCSSCSANCGSRTQEKTDFLEPLYRESKVKKVIGIVSGKAIKTINKNEGAISIYGERWEARALNDNEIPEGSEVEIVKNDSLTMFVKQK